MNYSEELRKRKIWELMERCEKNIGHSITCEGNDLIYKNNKGKILNVYDRDSGEDITDKYLHSINAKENN